MTIHIPISYFEPEIRKLYLEKKIQDICIDYAYNALVSFYENREIVIFSFNDFIKLDNRKKGYSLYKNDTEIILSF